MNTKLNRLSTICRDGVKCCVIPIYIVWLVLGGFHPNICLFSFRKSFVTCFCCFFCLFFVCFLLYCCLGIVREKRGGRGSRGEDAWPINYDNIELSAHIELTRLQIFTTPTTFLCTDN